MPTPKAVPIELSNSERVELGARLRRRKVARGDALRAEIVLLAADGLSNLSITERLGVARATVALWRGRFAAKRLDGLHDEPRPDAPPPVPRSTIASPHARNTSPTATPCVSFAAAGGADDCETEHATTPNARATKTAPIAEISIVLTATAH